MDFYSGCSIQAIHQFLMTMAMPMCQNVYFPSKVEATLRCQLWNFEGELGHSGTLPSAYVLHPSFKSGELDLLGCLESIRGGWKTNVPAWQH